MAGACAAAAHTDSTPPVRAVFPHRPGKSSLFHSKMKKNAPFRGAFFGEQFIGWSGITRSSPFVLVKFKIN
jgi:hypothetical protein